MAGVRIEATCRCGRVFDVHLGNLIRIFGDETYIGSDGDAERLFGSRLVCIRCRARHPRLRIVRPS